MSKSSLTFHSFTFWSLFRCIRRLSLFELILFVAFLTLNEVELLQVELCLQFAKNSWVNNLLDLFIEYLCLALSIGAFKLSMIFNKVVPDVISEAVSADHVKAFVKVSEFLDIAQLGWACTVGISTLYSLVAIIITIKRIVGSIEVFEEKSLLNYWGFRLFFSLFLKGSFFLQDYNLLIICFLPLKITWTWMLFHLILKNWYRLVPMDAMRATTLLYFFEEIFFNDVHFCDEKLATSNSTSM